MSFHFRPNTTPCICVEHSAFVQTAYGPRRLDQIDTSTLLQTREHGLQAAPHVYAFHLSNLRSLFAPRLVPVAVTRNTLGPNAPLQHTRLLCEQLIDTGGSVATASSLADGLPRSGGSVTYTLVQFSAPTSLFINGLVCVATKLPGDMMTAIRLLDQLDTSTLVTI